MKLKPTSCHILGRLGVPSG